ncbi:hypothetical protein [Paenisporosarcina sp. TG20]|uniref:hypothetical protein n=1 Tax=Paenisporosarcina sp. TG20 TaxID=1211706 RepID=UPI00031502A9|nr:hypothetical protein [Paenisporosarcina sp. TG20]
MKKTWITYHLLMLLILLVLIVLDIVTNIDKGGNNLITEFTEIAIYVSAINILLTMPIWIVVLLCNKRRMDKKALLIGLSLFLAFVGLTAWPVITTIGYMAY